MTCYMKRLGALGAHKSHWRQIVRAELWSPECEPILKHRCDPLESRLEFEATERWVPLSPPVGAVALFVVPSLYADAVPTVGSECQRRMACTAQL